MGNLSFNNGSSAIHRYIMVTKWIRIGGKQINKGENIDHHRSNQGKTMAKNMENHRKRRHSYQP
jgi:hypothetical protein